MRTRKVFVEVEIGEILVQHDQRGRMFPALYCRLSGSYFANSILCTAMVNVVAVDDSAGMANALSHELR